MKVNTNLKAGPTAVENTGRLGLLIKGKALKALTIGGFLSALVMASCGGGGGGGGEPDLGPVQEPIERPDVLTKLPVDRTQIHSILPYGSIITGTKSERTWLTFHLNKKEAGPRTVVYAPGKGKVTQVYFRTETQSNSIDVKMDQGHTYTLTGIVDPTIRAGDEVLSGQVLGATEQTTQSLVMRKLGSDGMETDRFDPALFFDEATSAELQSFLAH